MSKHVADDYSAINLDLMNKIHCLENTIVSSSDEEQKRALLSELGQTYIEMTENYMKLQAGPVIAATRKIKLPFFNK